MEFPKPHHYNMATTTKAQQLEACVRSMTRNILFQWWPNSLGITSTNKDILSNWKKILSPMMLMYKTSLVNVKSFCSLQFLWPQLWAKPTSTNSLIFPSPNVSPCVHQSTFPVIITTAAAAAPPFKWLFTGWLSFTYHLLHTTNHIKRTTDKKKIVDMYFNYLIIILF